MPPPARKKHSSHLVLGFLEGMSSRVFSEFIPSRSRNSLARPRCLRAVQRQSSLLRGTSHNLRARVKQHLRDKHKGKWNKFSVYLVRKSEHIRELESLILRIADPKGNSVAADCRAPTISGRRSGRR